MRAHITIKSRSRRSAWKRALVLAVSACALAIPASASGYGSERHASLTADTGASSQPIGSSDYSSLNASAPPASDSGGGQAVEYTSVNASTPPVSESGQRAVASGLSSLNAIAGSPGQPTAVSSPPADDGDGFHWGDAALGAGAALSIVALGGAALFTARRRTTVSPA